MESETKRNSLKMQHRKANQFKSFVRPLSQNQFGGCEEVSSAPPPPPLSGPVCMFVTTYFTTNVRRTKVSPLLHSVARPFSNEDTIVRSPVVYFELYLSKTLRNKVMLVDLLPTHRAVVKFKAR